jgi:hypothetical protein
MKDTLKNCNYYQLGAESSKGDIKIEINKDKYQAL